MAGKSMAFLPSVPSGAGGFFVGKEIHCRGCGKKLGEIVDGLDVIRHQGRVWAGRTSAISCERCGAVWQPELDVSNQNASKCK